MASSGVVGNNGSVAVSFDKPVIEAPKGTADFVVQAGKGDVANYSRTGSDLVLQLKDGRSVTIKDFFSSEAGHKLVLSSRDSLTHVDFSNALGQGEDGIAENLVSYTVVQDAAGLGSGDLGLVGLLGVLGVAGGGIALAADDGAGGGGAASLGGDGKSVDVTAPSAPLADAEGSVTNGSLINKAKPLFGGSAEPGAIVTVTIDDVPASVTADASGHWSYTPSSPLGEGTHSASITQTDAAGNVSPPTKIDFSVDTVAPSAPSVIVSDAVGDVTGVVTEGATFDDPRPVIGGQGEPGATITLTMGNTVVTVTVDENGTWSYQPTATLPNGAFSVSVTQTDKAGNVSPAATFSGIINSPPPPAPTMGATAADGDTTSAISDAGATKDNRPVFSGTGDPGATVKLTFTPQDGEGLQLASGVVVTVTVDSAGHWTYQPAAHLSDGHYDVSCVQVNKAGIASSAVTMAFTVDTVAPGASTVNVRDAVGDEQGIVTDGATIDDPRPEISGQGESGATITLTVGDDSVTVIVDANGIWSYRPQEALPDGTYIITVTQTDKAGNISPISEFTVTIDASVAPPTIAPLTLQVIDDLNQSENIVVPNGGITDDQHPTYAGMGEPGAVVTIVVDGGAPVTVTVDASGHWSYTDELVAIDLGDHTVSVTQTIAGGTPSTPVSQSFTLDFGSIGARALSIVSVSIPAGDGTSENVENVYDGVALLGSSVADATDNWSFQPQHLSEGSHTFKAQVVSRSGVEGPASDTWAMTVEPSHSDLAIIRVVDDRADELVMIDPLTLEPIFTGVGDVANGGNMDDSKPALHGVGAGVHGIVKVYSVDTLLGSAIADEDGNWTFTPERHLVPGMHMFTATVVDTSGHESAPTAAWTVRLWEPNPTGARPWIMGVTDDVGPVTGTVIDGGATNDTTPTLNGSFFYGANVEWNIYDNGALLETVRADAYGEWTFTPKAPLADGVHMFTAEIIGLGDDGTGTYPAVEPWTVTIDTAGPHDPIVASMIVNVLDDVAPLTEGIVNGNATNDTTPMLKGTSPEPNSLAQIYDDGALLGSAVVDAGGNWAFTPLLALRDHALSEMGQIAGANGDLFNGFLQSSASREIDFGKVIAGVPMAGEGSCWNTRWEKLSQLDLPLKGDNMALVKADAIVPTGVHCVGEVFQPLITKHGIDDSLEEMMRNHQMQIG